MYILWPSIPSRSRHHPTSKSSKTLPMGWHATTWDGELQTFWWKNEALIPIKNYHWEKCYSKPWNVGGSTNLQTDSHEYLYPTVTIENHFITSSQFCNHFTNLKKPVVFGVLKFLRVCLRCVFLKCSIKQVAPTEIPRCQRHQEKTKTTSHRSYIMNYMTQKFGFFLYMQICIHLLIYLFIFNVYTYIYIYVYIYI